MKHLYIGIILLASGSMLSVKQVKISTEKFTGVSFTENKGQVQDQFGAARPDVLFSGSAGNASFHIKRNGVSYQFCKWNPPVSDANYRPGMTEAMPLKAEPVTIYRLDQNWIHANPASVIETEHDLPGSNNYYYEHCPNGALNVKTYGGVWLKNIYNNISVHYYEKKGALKYDYEVAPYADYKKIQIEVKGAEIVVQKNGSLLIKTPFGDLEEGTPEVYQNHKKLPAKWLVKNNCLSFHIENYNPALALTIDPVVRSWGTYYGGSSNEDAYAITTDNSGNVYMTGRTGTSTSTIIATTGSHQASLGSSGNYYDAFLVKFDQAGVRLWATYYGGTSSDEGQGCALDQNGNIYITGITTSSAGIAIATVGAHQTTHGSNGAYSGAFLAKFTSNGVRLWGTYYGGTNPISAYGCATDASGSVFIAGITGGGTISTGTTVATIGAHQASPSSTTNDFFLAKFNGNGVRQWGTFYGSSGTEANGHCTTDASGNVYLWGTTNSAGGMATVGSYQQNLSGSYDAFLVKFTTNGVRSWGTYLGGTNTDTGHGCATDVNGNVYFCGSTSSSTGISTTGSHQSVFGGGNDSYLVKFNSNGARQWSTYYGDTGGDYATSLGTDAIGNVYLAGVTASSVTSIIATSGSHQTSWNGGVDSYLAKFNTSGVRQWGTYYGGTGNDYLAACAVGQTGDIYITGTTSSFSDISHAGAHQPNYSANNDGYLARFTDCSGPASQPTAINGKTTVCASGINTYSVNPSADGVFYSWSIPPGSTGSSTSNTISVNSGTASGIISLTVSNACGSSAPVTLSVNVSGVTPTITVNSGSICIGGSFTLIGGGANTYTYSSGSPVVSPISTNTYTVMGTNATGCVSTVPAVATVTVNAIPIISGNNGLMCAGSIYTLNPSGANFYTYSGGTNVVSPTSSTIYTITGSSLQGCMSTGTISVLVFQCVGIHESDPDVLIGISPNPSNGYFSISSPAATVTSVTVYDNIGKFILKKEEEALMNEVDLSGYPAGIYQIVIYANEHRLVTKVVKQ